MSNRRSDLPRASTFSRAARQGSIDTTQPPPMTAPNPRGRSPDPFLMAVVVMVDEATEPGITDSAAQKHRKALMNVVLERHRGFPPPLTNITGGQAVAFALRKRLKSDDEVAVLNTLTLLDELMRTTPYFYRYIATEKFFRRLWRFVVPDYKNGVKSMIPIFGKPKVHSGMRGNQSVVSERVRILIRAWAEEMSVMFHGRYDPAAGFFIERYNSKRERVSFPEVPKTPTPWVYPVNNQQQQRRRGEGSSRAGNSRETMDNMTLAEVENTVNLFSNLVDNASSISDLKEDACLELARRCKKIQENLTAMGTNMSKEEELARAIAVSETLEKALTKYKSSLENGHIVSTIPTIDSISLHSDDEGYDNPARQSPNRSFDRNRDYAPRASRYDDSSDFSSGGRDDWRAGDRPRERDVDLGSANKQRELDRASRSRELERANRERERERANREWEKERDKEKEREEKDLERDRERSKDRELNVRSRSYDEHEKYSSRSANRKSDAVKEGKLSRLNSTERRSRRPPVKPSTKRREKSESDLSKLTKERPKSSKKDPSKSDGLVDVPPVDESSEEEDQPGQSFTLLAERYSSTKGSRKTKSRSISRGKASKETPKPNVQQNDPSPISSAQSMSLPAMMNSNPAAMYQSFPGMGYNPMMVPNMYAMYGSVSHLPVQDPLGMMGAYQTVNPAMYYQSMNPHMYPGSNLQSLPSLTGPQPAPHQLQQQQIQRQQLQQQQQQQMQQRQQQPVQQQQSVQQQEPVQQQQQQKEEFETPQQLPVPGSSVETGQLLPAIPSAPQQLIPSNTSLQSSAMGNTPQQMFSMQRAASLYGSVGGMPPGMSAGLQPSMSMPSVNSGVPGMQATPGMASMPGVMGAGMVQQPQAATQDAGAQAAAYQSAMHQAAVAFNAAATMYRSVSGQQPLGTQGIVQQPGMTTQQAPEVTAEEENKQ